MYRLDVPKIQPGSLVIFGDQPVAFVAPFLSRQAPETTYVGYPPYLDAESDLRKYKLGQEIFERIAEAKRIYVVYSNENLPPDPSMTHLGLKIDYRSCQTITSNISVSLEICELTKQSPLATIFDPAYELTPIFIKSNKNISLSPPFCTKIGQKNRISFKIHSSLPIGKGPLKVFVVSGDSKPIIFGQLYGPSTVSTGSWVTAGDQISVDDSTSEVLASAMLLQRPCWLPH